MGLGIGATSVKVSTARYVARTGAAIVLALGAAACGGGPAGSMPTGESETVAASSTASGPTTVRLLTHDAFAISTDLIDQLKAETGITLEVVTAGDAGTMVAGAVLASGAPTADVLFGVDNTLLERARAADIFEPYQSSVRVVPGLDANTDGLVTPIDYGDVCINIDAIWFDEHNIALPTTLSDLTSETYRGLLTVIDPATSSPGLAFLLSTIARWPDSWQKYWADLKANDVRVAADWTSAYQGDFTVSGGGRPLVLSYATSPPAEIVYAEGTPPNQPRSTVMTDGCYRQIEYAGVLRGTAQPDSARTVVDWLASPAVQQDLPLSMFVFPARQDTPLPEVFSTFAARATNPAQLPPGAIADKLDSWLGQWDAVMGR